MRILWHSNHPEADTGYGNQTALFTRLALEAEHEVVIRGFYGVRGTTTEWQGIKILPGSFSEYGEDVLVPDHKTYDPDVHVALVDVWVFGEPTLRQVKLTSWCPIDHEPPPSQVLQAASMCRWVWSMSRHGERELARYGIQSHYVPHGVDTSVFIPADREQARSVLKIDPDRYVVSVVAANKGYPSRKNHEAIIKAWSYFLKKNPKALLLLHCNPLPVNMGVDLNTVIEFYDVPPDSIRTPNVYTMLNGDYGGRYLNTIYNAADMFLLPSKGEGFGIPAIEAQAAGCPVAVTGFSAQTELGQAGYVIPLDELDGRMITNQGSEQAVVLPSQILKAMEWGLEKRGDLSLRQKARDFALEYDARLVWNKYMQPAMLDAARAKADDRTRVAGRAERTAQRVALREQQREEVA